MKIGSAATPVPPNPRSPPGAAGRAGAWFHWATNSPHGDAGDLEIVAAASHSKIQSQSADETVLQDHTTVHPDMASEKMGSQMQYLPNVQRDQRPADSIQLFLLLPYLH